MHLIVEYCESKEREWLPPVSWKVESMKHDAVTGGAEGDLSGLQLVMSFPSWLLTCQAGGSMGPALIRLLSWGTRAGR